MFGGREFLRKCFRAVFLFLSTSLPLLLPLPLHIGAIEGEEGMDLFGVNVELEVVGLAAVFRLSLSDWGL